MNSEPRVAGGGVATSVAASGFAVLDPDAVDGDAGHLPPHTPRGRGSWSMVLRDAGQAYSLRGEHSVLARLGDSLLKHRCGRQFSDAVGVVAQKIAQHLVVVATEGRRRATRRRVVQVGLLLLVESAGCADDPRSRP
jgi:hypothetical protein